ncbi:MAG: CoA pyrophosphatase [Proteobacteria bacterium]|nr:CoA pyrophosphatase [Pseudomonadota bacterium]
MPHPLLNITATEIRQRFAGTSMPEDPLDVVIPPPRWPTALQEKLTSNLMAAAVLIPIIKREESLSVLLTERSPDLKHHAGQISFPGGRMDPQDRDIRATALREAQEEVGIDPANVEIVGYLDPNPTVTGYAVTPVVALVELRQGLTIDPLEVKSAFEVPLPFLLDEGNQELSQREFAGVTVPIAEFNYGQYCIWGATAGMLIEFRKILMKNQ